MNNISKKIIETGRAVVNDLKKLADKYVPFYKKPTASEEKVEASYDLKHYLDYENDVNQSFMNVS